MVEHIHRVLYLIQRIMSTQDRLTGSDHLAEIINQITTVVDVERIYVHKILQSADLHQTMLILISDHCDKCLSELAEVVGSIFREQQTYRFVLHRVQSVRDAIGIGNIYFYSVCRFENQIYCKPGSDFELAAAPLDFRAIREKARQRYQSERDKINSFLIGTEFYFEKGNYAQSAFMLHQTVELTFRAVEHLITARSKITHSIKAHQNYMQRFHRVLGGSFSLDSET